MDEDERYEFILDRANDYTPVATVLAKDLDEAYTLTQSIERHWHENPEVTPIETDDDWKRSTMVGDVIKTPYFEHYVIESFGFRELEDGLRQ